MEDDSSLPFGPLHAELERMRRWNLNQAIQDVDDIMKLLSNAREKIIAGEFIVGYHPGLSLT